LVPDGVVFEKKSVFLWAGLPTAVFFNLQKLVCSAQTQDIPKKIAKKKIQDGGVLSFERLSFFVVWKYVLWAFYSVYPAHFRGV
jgi:hypothetical protein